MSSQVRRVENCFQEGEPSRQHIHPILERSGAVIFDMDGVLADTEPLHVQTTQALVARRGVTLRPDECVTFIGMTSAETWRHLVERFGFTDAPDELTAEYESILIPALVTGAVANPGAIELVVALTERMVPLALASSSTRHVVQAVLGAIKLNGAFSAVVCGEDVQESKPNPAIFWEAANRLGVKAQACSVIEDSLYGMQAGRRAGMRVVGLRTRYTLGVSLPADLVVESLTELMRTPDVVLGL